MNPLALGVLASASVFPGTLAVVPKAVPSLTHKGPERDSGSTVHVGTGNQQKVDALKRCHQFLVLVAHIVGTGFDVFNQVIDGNHALKLPAVTGTHDTNGGNIVSTGLIGIALKIAGTHGGT